MFVQIDEDYDRYRSGVSYLLIKMKRCMWGREMEEMVGRGS